MLASIDIGNGYVKVITHERAPLSFRSLIGFEHGNIIFDAFGGQERDWLITLDGKTYTIGESAYYSGRSIQQIIARSRIDTDYYRILFAAALAFGIGQSDTPTIIVSLPPGFYYDKEKQKQALAGTYEIETGDSKLVFQVLENNLHVVPEGWGTAAKQCLSEDGVVTESWVFEDEIGVIDIGTYTTDFLQLNKMTLVRRGTDSIPHAITDIHEAIAVEARQRGGDFDAFMMERFLREGTMRIGGVGYTLEGVIQTGCEELSAMINGKIRTLWRGGDLFSKILLTGGGAKYVAALIKDEFPHAEQVLNGQPWFNNAAGGLRYLKFLQRMGR